MLMSSAAVDVSTRVRVSDPKPAHCSMCFRGPSENVVFYDCGAAFDAGTVINTESLAYVSGSDDLHLCASVNDKGQVVGGCVAELIEATGYKPELHRRQYDEIKKLELQRDHWRTAENRQRQENERLRGYIAELERHKVAKR